jgi:hypothetical protein
MKLDDLKNLPLIARGGQADIYDYGNGKVIRVPRRPQDYDRIRYEYRVYLSLSGSDVAAPAVYELVEVDNSPSIIMQRIVGISMIDQIKKQPFLIRNKAIHLAGMHLALLKVNADASITTGKDQAKFCIKASPCLTEPIKTVILGILDHLPGGNTLCHGDFHPGNILHSNGRDYIIDWSGASRGDIAADVAHTYILLKVVPRVPGIGLFMHAIQKQLGNAMASIYLKSTMKSMSLNPVIFSKWVLIKAAERTYYGLPSEKQRLQTFIAKYVDALSQGRNEDHFYKWI